MRGATARPRRQVDRDPRRSDLWLAFAASRFRGSLCGCGCQGEVCEGFRRGLDQGDERGSIRSRLISRRITNRRVAERPPFCFRQSPSCVARTTAMTNSGQRILPVVRMPPPLIRAAQRVEYEEVARVWMDSWVSTGLEQASKKLLAKLQARVPREIENGWSLYVADEGKLAVMLALHRAKRYLDQLMMAPDYQGAISDANCSPSPGRGFRTKSGCAARVKMKGPGAGANARALCSRKKRSSRRPAS